MKDECVSKLFLSCDLTGSTAFKQQPLTDPAPPWQKVFLQFYREFPQELYRQQKELDSDHLSFSLWKPVGDELLFTCDVRDELQIFDAVTTWHTTMRAYKEKSLDDTSLGVKGGAFIATFPGPDSRSSIPRNPESEVSDGDVVVLNDNATRRRASHSKYLYDYFGPSIDTGFRVLSKCTERYMTLSVEVAYALSLLHFDVGPDSGRRNVGNLILLDSLELKGVWGGKSYPLFALDLQAETDIAKAYRDISPHSQDTKAIHKLCAAHYSEPGWPFKLYLPDSTNGHFSVPQSNPLEGYLTNASVSTAGAETLAAEPTNPRSLAPDPPLG